MKHKWLTAAVAASLGLAVAGTAGAGTTEPPTDTTEGTTEGATEGTTEGTTAPAVSYPAEIATDIGVTDDTIKIGMLADLSGAFAGLVTEIVTAQEVYWDMVNANGGIAGRQIELVIEDNEYNVEVQQQKYDAIREEVAIISQSTGSPHTASIAADLVEDDLLAIPLSWYSGWADPDLGQNVFESYTSYCIESLNGIEWLAENRDVTTVALISFPGEYGGDGDAGARRAIEELGLELVYDGAGQVTPPSGDNPNPDQSGVISQVVASDADLVWTSINPATLAGIMAGAVGQGFDGLWSGNAPSYSFKLLGTEAAPLMDQYYIASAYVSVWGSDVPGMAAVVEEMTAAQPDLPVSDVYILGWTEAQITHAILNQAALNGDMTRAGIVAAGNEVSVDFGGLAPSQTWAGEPDDFIVRESYMYDVSLEAYNPVSLGEGGGSTGWELLEGPYTGDLATAYTYEGACFAPTG